MRVTLSSTHEVTTNVDGKKIGESNFQKIEKQFIKEITRMTGQLPDYEVVQQLNQQLNQTVMKYYFACTEENKKEFVNNIFRSMNDCELCNFERACTLLKTCAICNIDVSNISSQVQTEFTVLKVLVEKFNKKEIEYFYSFLN